MKTYNAKYIRTLNPCPDGIENFEKHYSKFDGKLSKLLALKKIPYSDKIWLASRVTDIKTLQMWSVLCAESVLHNYEKQFPNDTRIRDCIETTKKVILGKLPVSAAWSAECAAWSAACAAWSAAWSAACAARSEARSAAWSAECAAWSAACAARSAARSAAWSAAKKEQEEKNINILITLLQEEGL